MKQWLNRLVALLGTLILGATVLIGMQNPPPPAEARRPTPTPMLTSMPRLSPTVPATPTARGLVDLPDDRRGIMLAIQPNGTLRLIANDGSQVWRLDHARHFTNAAWSPDGVHIVAATSDGNLVMTHPERQDALLLLRSGQRLAGTALNWKDPLTVALAVERDDAPATVGLWSYRNRDLELLGAGRAPAARNGALAWITLDSRSIMVKRGVDPPEALIRPQQLDAILAERQADGRAEIAQSHGSALAWSPDGTQLAFATITRREGITFDWTIAVVLADGALRHWALPPDTAVYQLGWMPDGRLLFTDDRGLALIDLNAGVLKRLLPHYPAARYFALHPTGVDLVISTPTGLYRLPTSALEWPQVKAQPFGPQTRDYQRLDWCCAELPRPVGEP